MNYEVEKYNYVFNYSLKDSKNIFLLSLVIAGATMLLLDLLWIGIVLVFLLIFAVIYKEKFVLFSLIIAIFSLVSEVDATLRVIIQITTLVSLTYIFLNRYGFDFSSYPKLPIQVLYFFILFYSAIILSLIFTQHQSIGLDFTFRLTVFLYVAYLFYALIDTDKTVKLYLFSLLSAALIVVAASFSKIFDIIINSPSIFLIFQSRLGGFISNVNAIAAFLFIVICIITPFLFYGIRIYQRLLIIFLSLVFFSGIMISNSRGALFALTVGYSVIFFYLNRKILKILIAGIFIFILLVVFVEPLRSFLSDLIRIGSGLSRRDYLWQLSWGMIADNIWFGVGPGGWAKEMLNYLPVMMHSWQGQLFIELNSLSLGKNNSHNFYLAMFSDLGVLGFISSILLPFIYLNIGWKTIRIAKTVDREIYLLVIGLTAAGAGMFARGFFEGISIITYGWLSVDLPFWMIFGILCYYYLKLRNTSFSSER